MSEPKRPGRLFVPGLRKVSRDVIYPHVFPNSDREVGGVLIGRPSKDGGLPLITGAIPAISADEQMSTLTFTQESWEFVHKTLDKEFPEDDEIVGWYHSHPNFGIFLSGHDLFIHENFFSGPSQIAVVVDPINQTEGTFVWKDGKIDKLFEVPTPEGWTSGPKRERMTISARSLSTPAAAAAVQARPAGPVGSRATRNPFVLVAAGVVGAILCFGALGIALGGGGDDAPAKKPPVTVNTVSGKFGDRCLDNPNATKDENGKPCDPEPPKPKRSPTPEPAPAPTPTPTPEPGPRPRPAPPEDAHALSSKSRCEPRLRRPC